MYSIDPTPQDNDFEVLSQRVDDRIKTGLRDTLEQFECRLSAAIGELREVVSLSIADSLKAQSIGGSGEGPSCPRVINPVEESAPNLSSSRIDLTANQDFSPEFGSTEQRAVLETPPPDRDGTQYNNQAEYHICKKLSNTTASGTTRACSWSFSPVDKLRALFYSIDPS